MVSKRELVDVISSTALFDQLSSKECQRLAPVFKARSLSDGEALCRQGDTGDYLAVVADGKLSIEVEGTDQEQTVVSRRTSGEAVGEMACLDPSPRSATVRADGSATALILTRTMLDSLKTNASTLFSRVVRGIAYRLAEMLDETNALISQLLDVTRPPSQPRQPGMEALRAGASSGRLVNAIKEGLVLSPQGVLKGLDDEERQVLRSATEARRYEPGEVICMEGDSAPEAYFIAEGKVEVLRSIQGNNYRMAEIGVGGFLGQRSLLREGRRSATLRAGSEGATVFALSRERFQSLLEANSEFAIGFQEAVTIAGIRQLRLANDMASYLGTRGRDRKNSESTKRRIQKQADPGQSAQSPAAAGEPDLGEESDVDSLASAYLQTALEDWDVTPSELQNVEVEKADGEMSSAEKKMRNKHHND